MKINKEEQSNDSSNKGNEYKIDINLLEQQESSSKSSQKNFLKIK